MFVLDVVFHYGACQTFIYGDDADGARADYEKIKSALDEYRQFKNDNIQTIEIDRGIPGGRATLRLEHLMSVNLSDMTASKQQQTEWAAYKGALDGVHARERGRAALT